MKIKFSSFAFRDGPAPEDAGAIIDCRAMRNPHHDPVLRELTGMSPDVQEFVRCDPKFKPKFDEAWRMAEHTGHVAFGCFGGRHRSVAMVELLAREMKLGGHEVTIDHLAIHFPFSPSAS